MISRLKSLELQGYKTFANRTSFEFPAAVTAIVGPNGSGKSNITDALRWVLGEQSYSLLRGKKTEDMIFAGSDRRARSSMATATVILDNSDSWLPIDYSEVAIARRAYRDGSNEYLLNGQRVRLKDVSELLAESGLAERTYTIIGQGLVDAALALRAEDRRRLFEEAAGIGLHRSRRQEAVRRLADTQRNLERVEDILVELRPRLRSLERQARRAQEYDQAVADLRALLREWYGYHWHKAQEELSDAQSLASKQNNSLEITRQRELDLEKDINNLREKRGDIRLKLNELHRQSADFHIDREKTSRNLAVSEERARNLQNQESKLKSDLAQEGEEVSLLEERYRFVGEEVQNLLSELEAAEESDDSVRSEYELRQKVRAQIETLLAAKRHELVTYSAQQAKLNSRRAEYLVQVASLRNSLARAENVNQEATADRDDVQSKVVDLNRQLELATNEQSETESALEDTQKEYSQKNDQIKALSKDLMVRESEIAKLAAQTDVLAQAERSYAGYSEGAKSLLAAFKELQIDGSRGVLGTKLKTPKEYEIAIGAALGEYVDALVLEDVGDINQALSILEQKGEKAAILPLRGLHPGETPIEYAPGHGVIGRADELVEAPGDLKLAVGILLGSTLVVKDRIAAEKIAAAIRSDRQIPDIASVKIVTLLGEVFHATGPIKTSPGSSPVTLSRPREEKELQAKLSMAQDDMGVVQSKIIQVESELSEVEGKEGRLHQQLQDQRLACEKATSAHRQEEMLLEGIIREYKWRDEHSRPISLLAKQTLRQLTENWKISINKSNKSRYK